MKTIKLLTITIIITILFNCKSDDDNAPTGPTQTYFPTQMDFNYPESGRFTSASKINRGDGGNLKQINYYYNSQNQIESIRFLTVDDFQSALSIEYNNDGLISQISDLEGETYYTFIYNNGIIINMSVSEGLDTTNFSVDYNATNNTYTIDKFLDVQFDDNGSLLNISESDFDIINITTTTETGVFENITPQAALILGSLSLKINQGFLYQYFQTSQLDTLRLYDSFNLDYTNVQRDSNDNINSYQITNSIDNTQYATVTVSYALRNL